VYAFGIMLVKVDSVRFASRTALSEWYFSGEFGNSAIWNVGWARCASFMYFPREMGVVVIEVLYFLPIGRSVIRCV
jgi:hypothetical protein